jgi:glycogen operon protein
MRNFFATLLLSQGVPMLLAGDEFARTQGGNNNGYCQDSEISWIDWNTDEEGRSILEFTRRLIALRREHIVFHRNRFFQGKTIPGTEITDVTWLRPDGETMAAEDWGNGHAKAIALLLSGEAGLIHLTERGEPEADDTFLLLVNASHEDVAFMLPAPEPIEAWHLLVNTAVDPGFGFEEQCDPGSSFTAPARSLALLVRAGAG